MAVTKNGTMANVELPPSDPWSKLAGFSATTMSALFLERCQRTPGKVAFRVKEMGIYREVTWREYLERVESLCLGLLELGLEPGDRVAIMGDTCPAWAYADLATQCAGGISFGIYSTSSLSELQYLIKDAGAKFFVAENQEYVDKVLAVCGDLPHLKKVIVADTRAMFLYNDPRLMSFRDLEELGARKRSAAPGLFRDLVSRRKPEDIATLVYTSGTTGPAKGVMLSHHAFLWGHLGLAAVYPETFLNPRTRTVAYLSPAHILGKLQDIYLPMLGGYVTHFGESLGNMAETVFEVGPTALMGPPRIFTKFASQLAAQIETSDWLKKGAYHLAMKAGRKYASLRWEGKQDWRLEVAYKLAHWFVFRPLLDKVGFKNITLALTATAPVPPETVALWHTWGVNLLELYGCAEFGLGMAQRAAFSKPGNTGIPLPRVDYRLTDQGELVISSPAAMAGYWKNEEATLLAKKDGWVYTGDVVQVNSGGSIAIVERVKDLIVTAGGKNITPSEIEKAVKSSPYISEAVVFGHGKKYPVLLIEIDFDTVAEWARAHSIAYTSYASLAHHPDVLKLVNREVERANQRLGNAERIRVFRILPKELDPEDEADPVTATRKVQRKKMYEKMKDLVDSMYCQEEEARIVAKQAEIG
ncbi:MAG: AMP-binding protein [Chloroflexi bacterium]|nr:AMP-binding protein [Chloroflexota bacterium]